jgi:hypothetical protein
MSEHTLGTLASQINESVNALDTEQRRVESVAGEYYDKVLHAAQLVREARAQVQAAGLTWVAWAKANLNIGRSRLHELEAIANSENPREAVEKRRTATLKRVQASRATAKNGLAEPERRRLLDWVKKAELEDIRQILGVIANLTSTRLRSAA